jgi:hypothetical protein
MWKPLHFNQNVHPGDQVRYIGKSSFINSEIIFSVTRTDQFYFEIAPVEACTDTTKERLTGRIVRYFDIGRYIGLEVWRDE